MVTMPPEATRRIGSTVTVSGSLPAGQHTPADATTGSLTFTLPVSPRYGASLSVEKVDATTNTVVISGSIRGSAGTISLGYQYETIEFRADAGGTWRPIVNHLPKSAVDAKVAALAAAVAATSATLWKANTAYVAGQAVVNPSGAVVTAKANFTSGSSYSASNWNDAAATTYATLAQQLLGWAYSQSFRLVSATRDANEAITTGSVVWPDGATGTFTTDTASTSFPGAIDAYHVTHVLAGTTLTVTQTAVTRDAGGAVTAQPALTVA